MSRSFCGRCARPQSHCLCAAIPCLDSRTRVLILQHPSEARHALNTARIAALGLATAELRVGECFPELAQELAGSGSWLLFPGEPSWSLEQLQTPSSPRPRQLVVLDGTWRKARKLLYLNPSLAALPRLSLPSHSRSYYRIRKAPQALGAVATVEAVVLALNALEAPKTFDALLVPFKQLIDGQIQAMGEAVFQRHHGPSG